MTKTISIAPVHKTITVNVSQARAFEVFTQALDRWWPKSHHTGAAPLKQSFIEPRVGGRWYTIHEDGSENVTGIVRVWEPPHRIVHSWDINAMWKPDPSVGSEVEVRFVAEGPDKTRVELEHRGFERMGQENGQKMRGAVDSNGGWNGLLAAFKTEAES